MKRYLARHINQGKYRKGCGLSDTRFENPTGWTDFLITDSMVYSHRRTDYSIAYFDETAHIHDYYELVIYVSGNVDYVTEDKIFSPAPASAVIFSPGTTHNTRLRSASVYERYVFYFYPDIFVFSGRPSPFGELLCRKDGSLVFSIPEKEAGELLALLGKLDGELAKPSPNALLSYVRAMGVLDILSELSDTTAPKLCRRSLWK